MQHPKGAFLHHLRDSGPRAQVWPCRGFRHRFDSKVPRTRAWRWLAKPGQLHTEHVTRFSSRSDNPPADCWNALKSPSPTADPGCMSRKAAYVAVMAVALLASGQTVALGGTAVPRGQAERDVLRFLSRGWGNHRLTARLVDPRTHLLRNNTQAICRRARGQRAGDFVCVVRPARHRRREGLHVSYRSLAHGRFRVQWLYYRRG